MAEQAQVKAPAKTGMDAVIDDYQVELSPRQEKVLTSVVTALDRHGIKDIATIARCVSKKNAFVQDVFCQMVEDKKI